MEVALVGIGIEDLGHPVVIFKGEIAPGSAKSNNASSVAAQ